MPYATILETAATTAALTAFFAVFGSYFIELFKWQYKHTKEDELIRFNIADLSRHLQRGLDRIDEFLPEIKTGKKKIAVIHIEKLRVDEDNVIFSDENLRYLDRVQQSRVMRARVQIRNFNIDCDYVAIIYSRSDKASLERAIEYLRTRNTYLKEELENAFGVPPQLADKRTGGLLYFPVQPDCSWEKVPFPTPPTSAGPGVGALRNEA